MATLSTDLRNKLERTCIAARSVAEKAAKAALESFAVQQPDAYGHMSREQKDLRNKLRARARQLGDAQDAKDNLSIEHLAQECGYEHWHRMLFARFLAENSLLIPPELGTPITLDECKELAKDENTNLWALAGRYAQTMLPEIFRADDPVLQVPLAREDQLDLEELLDGLTEEVFTASDSLGWCYQFWQSQRKEDVNKAGNKIGADELPSVTQLFTEDYMVDFLLDNTLGAWWWGRCAAVQGSGFRVQGCRTEEECRRLIALLGCPWKYLRFTSPLNPLSMNGEGTSATSPLNPLSMNGAGTSGDRAKAKPVVARNFVTPEKLELARQFRKKPTEKEAEVWEWLRDRRLLDLKWRRQQIVEGFVTDFYCAEHRLALEIDGEVHDSDEVKSYDAVRETVFADKGIRTLRIKNQECTKANVEAVLSSAIATPSPFMERGAGGEVWQPAAGMFEGWPKTVKELKCLDPCMGSGHFVVAMFERLVAMRMAEEGLGEKDAVCAVIRDNLFGLEIDPRCTQIAAFNLALAAWRRVGHYPLPAMNLACSGLAPNAKKEDWLQLAGDNDRRRRGMERLYQLFEKGPILGSLINPRAGEDDLLVAGFHELQPLLERALAQEAKDDTAHEMAVKACGLAKAAEILAGQFTLVATNVPYLGAKKQDDVLKDYCERVHPVAKADLATCFVERCLNLCAFGGSTYVVTPQNWLFLRSYTTLRESLLEKSTWNILGRLGPKGFQTPMWDFNIILLGFTSKRPDSAHWFHGVDVSAESTPEEKAAALITSKVQSAKQSGQMANPDARIGFAEETDLPRLAKYTDCLAGIMNGDSPKFIKNFWEFRANSPQWVFLQSTVPDGVEVGGLESVIFFDEAEGHLREESAVRREKLHNADERGNAVWGRHGVAVCQMSSLPISRYFGNKYDSNVATIVPKDAAHLAAVWAFCTSPKFFESVRALDQKLNVTNATFGKVPFDLAHWQKVAAEKYPHGLPKPFSSDPTQWLFDGQPKGSDHPLHVAVARLLGYQWPRQTGSSFPDCPALGADGLEKLADVDGIVCIPSVRGEEPAAERLRKLLAAAYGKEWKPTSEREIVHATGSGADDFDEWLRNDFFEQHCDLFHQRPFLWHIWDGRKRDGFHAVVNYHTLAGPKGRKVLETLTFAYLGDWIVRQKDGETRGEDGAEARLAAALELKKRLEAIIEGEPPFDIFVRWKPLDQQAIGWEPDSNDGVRMNIRPFLASDLPGGKKGAGILRVKPKIKWDKDRGKEPQRDKKDFPWFWDGKTFTGDRVNDVHLTNEEKRTARDRF